VQQGPKLEAAEQLSRGRFGRAVALSADGNTALIGAPREEHETGGAYIFTRSGGVWTQQAVLSVGKATGGNYFGRAVALSADGTTALVGDPGAGENAGAAWVFVLSGGKWSQQGKLLPAGEVGPGQFGRTVSLSSDGDTALVGAWADASKVGAAYVYTRSEGTWSQQARLQGEEEIGPRPQFGRSVALSGTGNEALISGPGDDFAIGAIWLFVRSSGEWHQGHKLTATGETGKGRLGEYVAFSSDARTAVVGAPRDAAGVGAAWIFENAQGSWRQGARLVPSGESGAALFGDAIALSSDGSTALVGGREDSEGAGAAWAFSRSGEEEWTQLGSKLQGGEAEGASEFGWSAALSSNGETAMLGGLADGGFFGAAWAFVNPAPEPPPVKEPEPPTTGTGTGTGTGNPPPQENVLSFTSTANSGPVLGVSGNLTPIRGHVKVKLPGSKVFILITETELIPFGTIIDATNGSVIVTVAGPKGPEHGEFFQGEFLLTQSSSGVVLAKLVGGNSRACRKRHHRAHRSAVAEASKRKTVRKLWSNAHGTFATKGSYAAGAVQGTEWLTEDFCEGTLIRVTRDKVKVTDLVHHKTHIVIAGHSIFVKAP
jgi:hypothetical protein